jgi:hypothetical protein
MGLLKRPVWCFCFYHCHKHRDQGVVPHLPRKLLNEPPVRINEGTYKDSLQEVEERSICMPSLPISSIPCTWRCAFPREPAPSETHHQKAAILHIPNNHPPVPNTRLIQTYLTASSKVYHVWEDSYREDANYTTCSTAVARFKFSCHWTELHIPQSMPWSQLHSQERIA